MEALTGVNIAALTIYDMCKAVDKNMVISNIRLIKKPVVKAVPMRGRNTNGQDSCGMYQSQERDAQKT